MNEVPQDEFESIKSAVPEHLLEKANPAEKHTVGTISVLDQRTRLSWRKLVAVDESIGGLEARVSALSVRIAILEVIKERLKSYWILVPILGGCLLGILKAIEIVFGMLK